MKIVGYALSVPMYSIITIMIVSTAQQIKFPQVIRQHVRHVQLVHIVTVLLHINVYNVVADDT